MSDERLLDISWATILKIALAFMGFYLLYVIRNILVWFLFALIISVLFNPAISFFRKIRVSRLSATILVYVGLFSALGFFLYIIIPPFISEIQQFTQLFPQYFEKISPPLKGLGIEAFENFQTFLNSLGNLLVKASSNIFSAITVAFGGIFSTVTIFALAIFLSLEEKGIERIVLLVSPKKYERYILALWEKTQNKVATWFGARILSSISVVLMTFLACKILAIKYAVSFGLLAGILDIVPIIGPIISAVIIIIFTLMDSWLKALFFLIAFIFIQQIEGNILTPILTKKFVGLPPVLVLLSLMVGGELWGILGAILSIPLAGVIYEFLKDFLKKKKEEEKLTT